jgi:hypothetical protein
VSWLDKIESGDRALARLPMLERVAAALGVSVEALADPEEAERSRRVPDAAEVAAIRGALGCYEVIVGASIDAAEAPNSEQVLKQLTHVNSAFLASNFSSIGRHLPRLIIEAQRCVEHCTTNPQAVTRLLVQTYRVASSTLLKLSANETAWLAADRAILAARQIDDLYCMARATRSVARAMTAFGQPAEALAALLVMVLRMQPDVPRLPDDVAAMYGMLLLAGEIAAARLGDTTTADSMHEEASCLADARFGDGHDAATAFGVTNVDLHRVSAYTRMRRGDDALAYARTIEEAAVDRLPRERRSNFLLDLATAHYQAAHRRDAIDCLLKADRIAPEEVRCRPIGRELIASLVEQDGCAMRSGLADLARKAGIMT